MHPYPRAGGSRDAASSYHVLILDKDVRHVGWWNHRVRPSYPREIIHEHLQELGRQLGEGGGKQASTLELLAVSLEATG